MRDLRKYDPRNPTITAHLVGTVVGEVVGTGPDLVLLVSSVVAVSVALNSQVVLLGTEQLQGVSGLF